MNETTERMINEDLERKGLFGEYEKLDTSATREKNISATRKITRWAHKVKRSGADGLF
jgi:hypothetical protein